MMPEPGVGACIADWQRYGTQYLGEVTDLPQQEMRWLLQHCLGWDAGRLWRDAALPLPTVLRDRLQGLLAQRRAGQPLAYCLGRWAFMDLDLYVSPAVLIPRPDTEVLVRWALGRLPPGGRVADLGTGSGAIALAVAHARPDAEVWGVELAAPALAVAQENGRALALPVHWAAGDWGHGLPTALAFDLVLSNPPYLAADDPHLPALAAEPQSALVAGATGLEAVAAMLPTLAGRVRPGTWLGLEHGPSQGAGVRQLMQSAGWQAVETCPDWAGRDRISIGVWTAHA